MRVISCCLKRDITRLTHFFKQMRISNNSVNELLDLLRSVQVNLTDEFCISGSVKRCADVFTHQQMVTVLIFAWIQQVHKNENHNLFDKQKANKPCWGDLQHSQNGIRCGFQCMRGSKLKSCKKATACWTPCRQIHDTWGCGLWEKQNWYTDTVSAHSFDFCL